MSLYDVIIRVTLGLFDTIYGGCRATLVVAYSGVTGVRGGFVCLTRPLSAHPPQRQGH